jgi:hypothetical protein
MLPNPRDYMTNGKTTFPLPPTFTHEEVLHMLASVGEFIEQNPEADAVWMQPPGRLVLVAVTLYQPTPEHAKLPTAWHVVTYPTQAALDAGRTRLKAEFEHEVGLRLAHGPSSVTPIERPN